MYGNCDIRGAQHRGPPSAGTAPDLLDVGARRECAVEAYLLGACPYRSMWRSIMPMASVEPAGLPFST
jgi:hypothetical protein